MSRVSILILTILLIASIVWGVSEYNERQSLSVRAENNYQRAFHDLTYYMDLLHDTIGTTLAMNSDEQLSPQMIEVWRLTSEAQSNIGQLPLGLLPFNQTEEFLSEIGRFSYETAVRELDQNPLSEDEENVLRTLYDEAAVLKNELRQVQAVVLKERLRWTDVESALANGKEPVDNTIIDGFQTVEKKVASYTEAHNETGVLKIANEDHSFRYLTGNKQTEKEILEQAKELTKSEQFQITQSKEGSDVELFSLFAKEDGKTTYLDITKTGGHLLTLLIDRNIDKPSLSLNEGEQIAEKFVQSLDIDHVELYQTNQFTNSGLYSFVYVEDGVKIYSDILEVKVALDDGEVIGLTARDYYMNHRQRDIKEPTLTEGEALKQVNDAVKIEDISLAMIDNRFGDEILVYEFIGTMGNDTYRIFINATDGKEEKIERLNSTEIVIS